MHEPKLITSCLSSPKSKSDRLGMFRKTRYENLGMEILKYRQDLLLHALFKKKWRCKITQE